MTTVALSTALRRGELLGLRWQDVELLEGRLHVRRSFVLGETTTPKSRAGRRAVALGAHAQAALEEQFGATLHKAPESIVFCNKPSGRHPTRRSSRHSSGRRSRRPESWSRSDRGTASATPPSPRRPRRVCLRCSSRTKAGHAQGSTTERYLHATNTAFPEAAALAEARLFLAAEYHIHQVRRGRDPEDRKAPRVQGFDSSPGWTRTNNPSVNSRMLCQLSYRGSAAAKV